MENEQIAYALLGGLAIALVIAIATDLVKRKVYNWLTLSIALAAPVWWWATGLDLWPGAAIQLGLALGVFVFGAVMFAIGAMAAGDTKLMTAIALWFPPYLYLKFFVWIALFGGLVTLFFGGAYILKKKHRRSAAEIAADSTVGNIGNRDPSKSPKILIPYGIAIALAGLWVIYSEYAVAAWG